MTHDEQYAKPIPGYRVPLWSEYLASMEARALAAAREENVRVWQVFEQGGYPGLCLEAYDNACEHTPRHVLTAEQRADARLRQAQMDGSADSWWEGDE